MARVSFFQCLLDALRGRRDETPDPPAPGHGPYRAHGLRDAALPDDGDDDDPLAGRLPLPLAAPPHDPRTAEQESACVAPLVGEMMVRLGAALRPGITARKIESLAEALLEERRLRSSMKNFNAFPNAVSVSIDDAPRVPRDAGIFRHTMPVDIKASVHAHTLTSTLATCDLLREGFERDERLRRQQEQDAGVPTPPVQVFTCLAPRGR